jgi:hypothetical protein
MVRPCVPGVHMERISLAPPQSRLQVPAGAATLAKRHPARPALCWTVPASYAAELRMTSHF